MQNPRRAFNPDGSMIQPDRVETQLADGRHLAEIWCTTCHHEATVPIDNMPPALPIPDICLSYRCSKCGGKRLIVSYERP
jgi:hypothetical protein